MAPARDALSVLNLCRDLSSSLAENQRGWEWELAIPSTPVPWMGRCLSPRYCGMGCQGCTRGGHARRVQGG